jgi:hypothetical protein
MFPIIPVEDDAPEGSEQLGTKPKFWFSHPELGRCWFKESRPDTGEDWAEKVAAEMAQLLSLPLAQYELATWRGRRRTVSVSFLREGAILVHGNELLLRADPSYPAGRSYRVSQHTIANVLDALQGAKAPQNWTPPGAIHSARDVFVGYLLLDALIGNTDRHHENWGIVEQNNPSEVIRALAPTYDHASSLGRNESDERRLARLSNRDAAFTVGAYAARARSALYRNDADHQPMSTFEAWCCAAAATPQAASAWLGRLRGIEDATVRYTVGQVPPDRLSQPGADFARAMMAFNRRRLLSETAP